MLKRNPHLDNLTPFYIFSEIRLRVEAFQKQSPKARVLSLSVGDTTVPLSPSVIRSLIETSVAFGTEEGYMGYGPDLGLYPLRKNIAERLYSNLVDPDAIFISDGAKCDLARLQALFGGDVSIGIQDPSYPVYIEGSMIHGVQNICFMPCTKETGFFPDLKGLPDLDLIYICSPNNPTGIAYNVNQMKELVEYAKQKKSLIIFDSAYSAYIQNGDYPKTIFSIPGAKEVAIEVGSFSKLAGFTGIRLGWTIVSKELRYQNGHSIRSDWHRIMTTLFNGASLLSQYAGIAALSEEGMEENQHILRFYLENAAILKAALTKKGLEVFGGIDAPYLWVGINGYSSWEIFEEFLQQLHIVTTPGSGFGQGGEGFIRLSAYGKREEILEAANRLAALQI